MFWENWIDLFVFLFKSVSLLPAFFARPPHTLRNEVFCVCVCYFFKKMFFVFIIIIAIRIVSFFSQKEMVTYVSFISGLCVCLVCVVRVWCVFSRRHWAVCIVRTLRVWTRHSRMPPARSIHACRRNEYRTSSWDGTRVFTRIHPKPRTLSFTSHVTLKGQDMTGYWRQGGQPWWAWCVVCGVGVCGVGCVWWCGVRVWFLCEVGVCVCGFFSWFVFSVTVSLSFKKFPSQ